MCKLKIVFPCDFEIEKGEDRNKLNRFFYKITRNPEFESEKAYRKNNKLYRFFYKIIPNKMEYAIKNRIAKTKKDSKYEFVEPIMEIKFDNYLYNSPMFSINDVKPFSVQNNKRSNNCLCAVDIMKSAFNIDFKEACGFIYDEVFYPYGISVVYKKNICITEAMKVVEKLSANFMFPDVENDNKPNWIIYDKPLFIMECSSDEYSNLFNGTESLQTYGKKELHDDNQLKNNFSVQFGIANETIICNLERKHIMPAVVAINALKQISGKIRMNAKLIALQKIRNASLINNLHKNCAMFYEIFSSTIFSCSLHKQLFSFLKNNLLGSDITRQVDSAREYMDFVVADNSNRKTEQINETVFITGYIGLILAFFAFIPLELQDMMWISESLHIGYKICCCILIILSVIVLCNIILKIYHGYNTKHCIGSELWRSSTTHRVLDGLFNFISKTIPIIAFTFFIFSVVLVCLIVGNKLLYIK